MPTPYDENLFTSGEFYQDSEVNYQEPGNPQPGKLLGRNVYGFAGKPTLPRPPRYTLRWQIVGTDNFISPGSNLFALEYYLFKSGGLYEGNLTNQIYFYHTHHRLGTREWHGREPFVGRDTDYEFHYFGDLPIAVKDHLIVPFNNRLYLIGGIDENGNELNTVYSTPIPSKVSTTLDTYNQLLKIEYFGNLLNWTQEANFPFTLSKAQYAIVNEKLYILAGFSQGKQFYNIYSPMWNIYHPVSWSVVGGIPNTLENVSLTVDESTYSIYLVGQVLDSNFSCPVFKLQFLPSHLECKGVYYIGNTPRNLGFYSLSKVNQSFYLLGNYNYSVTDIPQYKNQIYFMRDLGNPLVDWEFYEDLPNNYIFNRLIIMHNTFYILATEKTTLENVIIQMRLVVYERGNKIYDY